MRTGFCQLLVMVAVVMLGVSLYHDTTEHHRLMQRQADLLQSIERLHSASASRFVDLWLVTHEKPTDEDLTSLQILGERMRVNSETAVEEAVKALERQASDRQRHAAFHGSPDVTAQQRARIWLGIGLLGVVLAVVTALLSTGRKS